MQVAPPLPAPPPPPLGVSPLPDGTVAPSSPAAPLTLVITNQQRLAGRYGAARAALVMDAVNHLAADLSVQGVVLDTQDAAAADYARWDADPGAVGKANQVAADIRSAIRNFQLGHPGLQYLVVAGNDNIVPFYRHLDGVVADGAGDLDESFYTYLDPNSRMGAAVKAASTFTDDFYANLVEQAVDSLPGRFMYPPQLAVGRLIEQPEEIVATITGYLNGGASIDARSGLVVGLEFLDDTSAAIQQDGLHPVDALRDAGPNHWAIPNHADQLLANAHDLASLNLHGTHFGIGIDPRSPQPDPPQRLTGYDLDGSSADLRGRLVFSIACQTGQAGTRRASQGTRTRTGTHDCPSSCDGSNSRARP